MKQITERVADIKFGKNWLEQAIDDKGPVKCADWKESVDEVLKAIDQQLKPHGLEITQVELGDDAYYWFVSEKGKS